MCTSHTKRKEKLLASSLGAHTEGKKKKKKKEKKDGVCGRLMSYEEKQT
jgi:hypothetical protein